MTEAQFQALLLIVFLGLAAFVIIRNAIGQRQVIWWYVCRFVFLFLINVGIMYVAKVTGLRGWWVQYAAIVLPFSFYFTVSPKRSRHIPLRTKQRLID